ncbi:hypothetical protein IMM1_18360 [Pseudocoprococcus immobilis]
MGIGDQAGTCAQLFYVKERSYGFEQELDVAIKVVMVMKDMVCKVCDSGISGGEQEEQNCTCKDPDD